jgi:hypothetical protein
VGALCAASLSLALVSVGVASNAVSAAIVVGGQGRLIVLLRESDKLNMLVGTEQPHIDLHQYKSVDLHAAR